jgi:hypothetical protein
MHRFPRRTLVSLGYILTWEVLGPAEARADLFGGDLPLLAQIVTHTMATAVQTAATVEQVVNQIRMMEEAARRLDIRNWDELMMLLNGVQLTLNTLTAGVTSIGYTLKDVNREFTNVYREDLRYVPQGDLEPLFVRWQKEIIASARVAERAQTQVSELHTFETEARKVLERSTYGGNEVAQLQNILQMLALMRTQMSALHQSLDVAARVATNAAATAASEKLLVREHKKRNMANYTTRGAPVPVHRRLP